MTDGPFARLDPDRLREERRDVDLGDDETGFDRITNTEGDESAKDSTLDGSTAGINPPAR